MALSIPPTFVLLTTLAFAGPPNQEAPLAEAQKVQIVKEVKAVVQAMANGCQRLDIDVAAKDFQQDKDTLVVSSEGQILEPKLLREGLRAFYASQASMSFTRIQEELRILAPDLVLYAWSYKVDGTSKKGAQWVVDPEAASFLLRKVDGAWKFIFYQESCGPVKRVPTAQLPAK